MTDRHGRVVGVDAPTGAAAGDGGEPLVASDRKNLAATGKLRHQAELRNQFSAFHVDPGPSVRR